MNDDRFDQNFVWYEWSFVSPGDVPGDDLRVTTSGSAGFKPAVGAGTSVCGDRPVQDDEWRWTM